MEEPSVAPIERNIINYYVTCEKFFRQKNERITYSIFIAVYDAIFENVIV